MELFAVVTNVHEYRGCKNVRFHWFKTEPSGARKPPGAVYVGRGTKWGNPFKIGVDVDTLEEAIARFRSETIPTWPPERIAVLRGKDLMCWCPLGAVCHADCLLELANASRNDSWEAQRRSP